MWSILCYTRHAKGRVLFGSRLTLSYVSAYLAFGFDSTCEPLSMTICLSSPRDSLGLDRVYRSCVVTFMGSVTWLNLIILDIVDFDWLYLYHGILLCYLMIMTLTSAVVPRISWKHMLNLGP